MLDKVINEIKDYFKESRPYEILLTIESANGTKYIPEIVGEIVYETEHRGSPSKLTFTVMKHNCTKTEGEQDTYDIANDMREIFKIPQKKDVELSFPEGAIVELYVNEYPVFKGFVFEKTRDKNQRITCTCYDQLRYLKNKHTMSYKGITATELIRRIAGDFKLKTGLLANTQHQLPARVESNKTLLDMIYKALDITTGVTGKSYAFFDIFGYLTLRDVDQCYVPLVINEEGCANFDYTSSIDRDTYNQYVIYHDKSEGKASCGGCSAKSGMLGDFDPTFTKMWGVLQYHEKVADDINLEQYGATILKDKTRPTRHLSVSDVIGHLHVRAGTFVPVQFKLGDLDVNYQPMRCDTVTHRFTDRYHLMDITLTTPHYHGYGGDFV